jgi:hypothetical protein
MSSTDPRREGEQERQPLRLRLRLHLPRRLLREQRRTSQTTRKMRGEEEEEGASSKEHWRSPSLSRLRGQTKNRMGQTPRGRTQQNQMRSMHQPD